MALKYFHNPRCSKSRQGLALLEEKGIHPEVVLYMDGVLEANDLESVLKKYLKSSGATTLDAILRKKEDDFKAIKKLPEMNDAKAWAMLITKHPKILERPLLVGAKEAVIGRPPEDLLKSKDL